MSLFDHSTATVGARRRRPRGARPRAAAVALTLALSGALVGVPSGAVGAAPVPTQLAAVTGTSTAVPAQVTTAAVPAAPTALEGAAGDKGAGLLWQRSTTSGIAGYAIYRSTSLPVPVTGTPVNSSLVTGQTYVNSGLTNGTTYHYVVVAVDSAGGRSEPSNTVSVRPQAPAVPTGATIDWLRKASSVTTRAEANGVAAGGYLYVFGGQYSGATQTLLSERYDPASDTWSPLPDLPELITHAPVVPDGNTLWILGGYLGLSKKDSTTHVWKYDTEKRTYTAGPPLPQPRGAGGAVLVGRDLHYFTGAVRKDSTGALTKDFADHWVLDLDNQAAGWVASTPVPNPRNHVGTVHLNGKIYLVGGQHGEFESATPQTQVDIYDLATRTWTRAADLPVPRGHISASTFVWNGKILVVGGSVLNSQASRTIFEYDPATNAWTTRTNLTEGLRSPVADLIDGKIVLNGGRKSSGPTADTWIGSVAGSTPTDTTPPAAPTGVTATGADGKVTVSWTKGTETDLSAHVLYRSETTPVATTGAALTQVAASATSYVDTAVTAGKTYHYVVVAKDASGNASPASTPPASATVPSAPPPTDTGQGSWAASTALPQSLLDAGGVAIGTKIYVVAGKTSAGPITTLRIFDTVSRTWSTGAPLPGTAVENPGVVAHNGQLYVVGGSTSAFTGAVGELHRYDPGTNTWTRLAGMGTARGGAAVAAVGGTIWALGGLSTTGASLKTTEKYDVATNTWSGGPPMATDRDNAGAAAVGDGVLVFGGRDRTASGTTENANITSTEFLAAGASSWQPRASMITGRRAMAVGVLNGKVVAAGGERQSSGATWPQTEEYDPTTNTWRALARMTTPRHGAAAAVVDGRLHAIGGGASGGSSYGTVHEVFTPSGTTQPPPPGDTTPPPAPTAVTARVTGSSIAVDWAHTPPADLAGFRVYRSTSTPVAVGAATLLAASESLGASARTFTDTTAQAGTTYHYVVVARDTTGNASSPSASASATVPPPTQPTGFSAKVRFATATATPPSGYLADWGQAYGARTDSGQGAGMTYGWVRVGTATPVDLSKNGRLRTGTSLDARLTGFMHMDFRGSSTSGTAIPGSWEIAVPNGSYTVTASVGDAGAYYDSTHALSIEGVAAVAPFTPTSAQRFGSATKTVTVSDGRLTLTQTGGTNTKLNYVDVVPAGSTQPPPPGDTTPPAAPTGVTAAPSGSSIAVGWARGPETDLAGYRVYRSTSTPVSTTGAAHSGATLLTGTSFSDSSVTAGTTYHYVVVAVDTTGNASAASASVSATVSSSPPPSGFSAKVRFQSSLPAPPDGYVADWGQAYGSRTSTNQGVGRTYGWVRVGTTTPLDLSKNGRVRTGTATTDARLTGIMHMDWQSTAGTGGTAIPGSWEIAVPNGSYAVTVSVGDAGNYYDSVHGVAIEGVAGVAPFTPTSSSRFGSVTRTVTVADGRLTVSQATGAKNTKINYVDVVAAGTGTNPDSDTTPPAPPAGVTAAPNGESSVTVGWTAGSEPDVAGYRVYRSTSTTVSTTGTPTGTVAHPTATFTDTTVVPGTTYHYAVVAVDRSNNASAASAAVRVVVPPSDSTGFAAKVRFQSSVAAPPAGYLADWGQPYGARSGANQGVGRTYGWVHVGTSTALDLTKNGRVRSGTTTTDPLLTGLMHMDWQSSSGTAGTAMPGSWEIAVPNGSYAVTVSVGDAGNFFNATYQLSIEDQNAVAQVILSDEDRFRQVTRTVHVADGRLTLSPAGGVNTKINYVDIASVPSDPVRPRIASVDPANLTGGVTKDRSVTAGLAVVAGGIDRSTLTTSTVRLTVAADGSSVPGNVNTSGGGDVIVLTPDAPLVTGTTYRFDVTSGVRDVSGNAFQPWSSVFTVGTVNAGTGIPGVAFDPATTPATGQMFTSVTMGPDDHLYAGTLNGYIFRYPVAADGALGAGTRIDTVRLHAGGARTIIGMAFDPASTAANPILWITENRQYVGTADVPDWTGKIVRLTGASLQNAQDVVVGLPRSARDHESNSLAFKDGMLYLTQGSNTAMGAPDSAWEMRPERVLSAAVLKLDPAKLPATLPLDVKTEEGGTYDPFATGAPLTLHATGVRNAYDLVWHSNGRLYVPTNGSARGGNMPATPATLPPSCANRVDGPWTGPAVPGVTSNPVDETDWVFRVSPGGYYGHPNPARCEWSFNGGNPTSAADPFEATAYPVGVKPDRNYRLDDVFDAGMHASANGTVEYTSDVFGAALKGKLIVVRYSASQDLMVLDPSGTDGKIVSRVLGVAGFKGFDQPLDIALHPASGSLYVTELGGQRISRLVPRPAG